MKIINLRLILTPKGVLFTFAISAAFLSGCGQSDAPRAGQASSGKAKVATPARPRSTTFKTSFQNESESIVQSVATDIAEMALYAKSHSASKEPLVATAREMDTYLSDSPKYNVTVKLPGHDLSCEVPVDSEHFTIWSPETYANLTKETFKSLGLNPPATAAAAPSAPDLSLLDTLLSMTASTIQAENLQVSRALAKNFADPDLHEKAALLLGAFALRENSGCFFEIRSPLSRMTAHLAMARALGHQSGFGENGRVAEALLYTLMNNEKQALAKITLIGQGSPVQLAWTRALTTRNTADYRPLAAAANRTSLETIEYFRAYCLDVDGDLAWDKLTDSQKGSIPDFYRILNLRNVSVGLGHVLLRNCIKLEMAEMAAVLRTFPDRQVHDSKAWFALLNELPDRCVALDSQGASDIHVIGPGQWGMFFQRHLCQAIVKDYRFMNERWGVPDQAREFSEKCDGSFSSLRLYPFVRKMTCRDERSYRSAVDDAFTVIKTTPQVVAAGIWNEIYYKVNFAALYRPQPPELTDTWFSHNPPPGTAYDPFPRFDHSNLVRCRDAVRRVDRLFDLSPYDIDIDYGRLSVTYHHHATYEQTEQGYHAILEYSSAPLQWLADTVKDDSARYESIMLKCAALDPYYYYKVADYWIEKGQEDRAIPSIQKGMDLCSDSVSMSSYAGHMVRYYVSHGQTAKAAQLADAAAEVYSYAGLEAKAEFLESQGQYHDALDYYKKIEERYGSSDDVIQFCGRYKTLTGKSDFDGVLERRAFTTFPQGKEKVCLADFSAPPRDGIFFQQENKETAKVGLKSGTVIVALDGVRVHNLDQYDFLRATETSPDMHFIVWQNNHYRELTASPPKHRFGVDIAKYSP